MFIIASIIILATKFSHIIFGHPKFRNEIIEPEIKYIFLLLLIFSFFANLGKGHAILPAFLLGLLMSGHFSEPTGSKEIRNRLRVVA